MSTPWIYVSRCTDISRLPGTRYRYRYAYEVPVPVCWFANSCNVNCWMLKCLTRHAAGSYLRSTRLANRYIYVTQNNLFFCLKYIQYALHQSIHDSQPVLTTSGKRKRGHTCRRARSEVNANNKPCIKSKSCKEAVVELGINMIFYSTFKLRI